MEEDNAWLLEAAYGDGGEKPKGGDVEAVLADAVGLAPRLELYSGYSPRSGSLACPAPGPPGRGKKAENEEAKPAVEEFDGLE